MIIKRTINGVEVKIELTNEEKRKIYYEQKEEFEAEDICSRYCVPNNRINETVNRFEKSLENNDLFWECYWETVNYVCNEMRFEEKEDE